jgi:RNA polymerase sigma-70 factor, ECF subfamily
VQDVPLDPRIARAAKGDRAAAGEILEELLPRVRNLVRYLVRGDSEVDDLTQKALLAILRGLSTYRAEGSLVSWANKITVRETLRDRKAARAEAEALAAATPELVLLEGDQTQADYLERRRVVKMLDRLPSEQRDAIVLHHVVGLSIPEVATELALSFDTVKSRVRLGMEKLRADAGERA